MNHDQGLSDDWLGIAETEALRTAMIFINKLEMLTDLCIHIPDRVFDTDDKKKNGSDSEDEAADEDEEEGNKEKFAFLNVDMLTEDWDNEDNRIIDDDEKMDPKNQILMRNLQAYKTPMAIIGSHGVEEADDSNAYLRVLEKCYIFLLKFVRKNKVN